MSGYTNAGPAMTDRERPPAPPTQKVPAAMAETSLAIESLRSAVEVLMSRLTPVQGQEKGNQPQAVIPCRQPCGVLVADQMLEVVNQLDRIAETVRAATRILEI